MTKIYLSPDSDVEDVYEDKSVSSGRKLWKAVRSLSGKVESAELKLEPDAIVATVRDSDGYQSDLSILSGEIDLKVDADGVISAINLSSEGIVINAAKVNLSGFVTFTNLSTSGQTTINGANITTGSINADRIVARTITADRIISQSITRNEIALGTITANQIASNTITAAEIAANTITANEIYAKTLSGVNFLVTDDGAYGNITFEDGGKISNYPGGGILMSAILFARDIRPSTDNDRDLGSSSFRWDDIYATNNVIQTSDKRLKKDIDTIDSGLELLWSLKPVQFRWKDGQRLHYGFIAQDLKKSIKDVGIETIGAFVDSAVTESIGKESRYGIRYNELIALNTLGIQNLKQRLDDLEARLG